MDTYTHRNTYTYTYEDRRKPRTANFIKTSQKDFPSCVFSGSWENPTVQKPAFPEASRKGRQRDPEGKLEGVFPVACFPVQNWRERPEDSSQHLPERFPGCPEGKRKGIRKGKYEKSHFQSNCLGTRPIPGFVSRPFPGRKWITYSKPPSPGRSPEGKRVFPGRQTGRVIFENSVW